MLHKDPKKRPTLSRILAHPFLSSKKVVRMVGEKAAFDVFISYRVASDSANAQKLYDVLTAKGMKVWLDIKCLDSGENWKEGFVAGLVSSSVFVCLISRSAVYNTSSDKSNFTTLQESSPTDNFFLELRLSLELQQVGLCEAICPLLIGAFDETTKSFSLFDKGSCPVERMPDIAVDSVERDLQGAMEMQALGKPLVPRRTVKSVVSAMLKKECVSLVGPETETFDAAAQSIWDIVHHVKHKSIPPKVPSIAAIALTASQSQSQELIPETPHTQISPRGSSSALRLHRDLLASREQGLVRLREEVNQVLEMQSVFTRQLEEQKAKRSAIESEYEESKQGESNVVEELDAFRIRRQHITDQLALMRVEERHVQEELQDEIQRHVDLVAVLDDFSRKETALIDTLSNKQRENGHLAEELEKLRKELEEAKASSANA
jgi:hypothetical protein